MTSAGLFAELGVPPSLAAESLRRPLALRVLAAIAVLVTAETASADDEVTAQPPREWSIYDVDPSDSSANTFGIGAGLLWQPSASCSQSAGVIAVP